MTYQDLYKFEKINNEENDNKKFQKFDYNSYTFQDIIK